MSNTTSNRLAATFFAYTSERSGTTHVGSTDTECLRFGLDNPLLTMRLLCMDSTRGQSYDSEELAPVLGIPENWLSFETLNAPLDEVLTALGKMALIYLSGLRNEALLYGYEIEDVREDPLLAVETFAEGLKNSTH